MYSPGHPWSPSPGRIGPSASRMGLTSGIPPDAGKQTFFIRREPWIIGPGGWGRRDRPSLPRERPSFPAFGTIPESLGAAPPAQRPDQQELDAQKAAAA